MLTSKKIIIAAGAAVIGVAAIYATGTKTASPSDGWIDSTLEVAASQLKDAADTITVPGMFPRSLMTDYSLEQLVDQLETSHSNFKVELLPHPSLAEFRTTRLCDYTDWTSGFFPGSLWLAYEMTGDEGLRTRAVRFTNMMHPASFMTDTHDLGFMINCSYGQAMRLAPSDSIKSVIVRAADNLAARFDANIGCIRSWDFGEWNFPVIIDNMMNLQLLFNASKITGDKKYYDIALRHARTTIAHHFRPDYTCYHVVSYRNDGTVESAGTFQGKNDASAWARGQGWALYGFTETYRETGERDFLDRAVAVADMVMSRIKTADKVPYWDLDARDDGTTPRDASAAAVIASGMIELGYIIKGENGRRYINYAEDVLRSLASPAYLAARGTNNGFVLMHSTGSLPHGSEIDTPLNYADYYFLEALNRLQRVKRGENPVDEFEV